MTTFMSSILNSPVARKLVMAISGLFLVIFLLVHLGVNLALFGGAEPFNQASHFMGTNPIIQVMQPILALGFIVHIIMGIVLELKNKAARPIKYSKNNAAANSSWASRNMIITGAMVLAFLALHIVNYFIPFKFGEVHDHYELVTQLFTNPIYTILYVVAFVLLGLHLSHGFQSSLTSMGLRNSTYKKCIQNFGNIYSIFIAVGFSAIAIWFFIKNMI